MTRFTLIRTKNFDVWLSKLKDFQAKARIIERLRSAERGNWGDCETLGGGVSEMRLHFGPGYRIYFTRTQSQIYVLLCGGTKRRQQNDIIKAKKMAQLLKEEKT